jgi:cytochrome c peroxidase
MLSALRLILVGSCLLFLAGPAAAADVPVGPGDDKRGYDAPDYETRSRRLDVMGGVPVALIETATSPPLGLPPLSVPPDNAITEARIALGRRLFFDRRLSGNGTMSCAMCHVPEQGFAHNEMRTAVGIEGRSGRRNARHHRAYRYKFRRGRTDQPRGWLHQRLHIRNPAAACRARRDWAACRS